MRSHTVPCLLLAGALLGAARGDDAVESIHKVREYKNRMEIPDRAPPSLDVKTLKVGAVGKTDKLDGKVMQIVNGGRALVGVRPAGSGGGYETWVAVNCPTAGMKEGQEFPAADWDDVTGGGMAQVIGTLTYKTVVGERKTVFILRPIPKPAPEDLLRGSGKPGAAAYDNFPEPLRGQLVKAWRGEVAAIKKAIEGDMARLAAATTARERDRYERAIEDYRRRLRARELNSPPYFTREQEQAIRAGK